MIAIYLIWRATMWFAVMFALFSVAIAVAAVAVIGAAVYGLASPSRTPASCLRSLWLNARQAVAEIDALRPS